MCVWINTATRAAGLHTTSSIPITAHKTSNGKQNSPLQMEPFVQPKGPWVDIFSLAKETFFLGATIVKRLTEELHGTYHHVFYDNFFSSVDLALDLLRAGLYSCGTLRSNCKSFPALLKPVVKKGLHTRGSSKTYQHEHPTVTVWQDNRLVTLISTNSDPTSSVVCKNRDGTAATYSCPDLLALYSQNMGGADHNDQLCGYYHVWYKCRKSYKYVFWFLLDLAITNAYVLSQLNPDNRAKHVKVFRASLENELIGTYSAKRRAGLPSIGPPTMRFCQHCSPMKVEWPYHRCHYCHNYRKRRQETVWCCNECQLYLWHTEQQASGLFWIYQTRHVDGPTSNHWSIMLTIICANRQHMHLSCIVHTH